MPIDFLTHWGLQTGLSLSILILFILIIRKPFARHFGARAAYALWALPALRLFTPAISLPVLRPSIPEITPTINYMGVDILSLAADTAVQAAPVKTSFTAAAIIIWLCGAILWLAWQLGRQYFYALALRINSRDITTIRNCLCNAGLSKAVETLNVPRPPHIRISRDTQGPLVTGLLKPMIILPSNFETQFAPAQQHLALLHEMAHIRRKDLWAAFAVILLRAIYWPNPLIHYAARKFRNDQEAACDATVLRLTQTRTSVYAQTLIQAAKSTQYPAHAAPLGLTIYHPLKERLTTMKTHNHRSTLTSRVAAGALLLSVFALTAPLSLADGASETRLAGAPTAQNKSTQKIKVIEDINGVKTEKQYEIETEGGITKAWSVDEWGHKMEVNPESIKGLRGMRHMDLSSQDLSGQKRMIIKRALKHGAHIKIDKDGKQTELKDGEFEMFSEEDIEALVNSTGAQLAVMSKDGQFSMKNLPDGKEMKIVTMTSEHFDSADIGPNATVIVENLSEHDMDFDFDFEFEEGQYGPSQTQHAKAMMDAVSGLLDGVQTDKLSSKAQRKIEKARKALQEAQDAIEASK